VDFEVAILLVSEFLFFGGILAWRFREYHCRSPDAPLDSSERNTSLFVYLSDRMCLSNRCLHAMFSRVLRLPSQKARVETNAPSSTSFAA
jgi:hypothetical protein